MKCEFKHQDLQMFWSQIKQICVIFTHLKLWIAVARHTLQVETKGVFFQFETIINVLVGYYRFI